MEERLQNGTKSGPVSEMMFDTDLLTRSVMGSVVFESVHVGSRLTSSLSRYDTVLRALKS